MLQFNNNIKELSVTVIKKAERKLSISKSNYLH